MTFSCHFLKILGNTYKKTYSAAAAPNDESTPLIFGYEKWMVNGQLSMFYTIPTPKESFYYCSFTRFGYQGYVFYLIWHGFFTSFLNYFAVKDCFPEGNTELKRTSSLSSKNLISKEMLKVKTLDFFLLLECGQW